MLYPNFRLIMGKISVPILFVVLITALASCVVISPKKYNALLAQKDSLSLGWEAARAKIVSLEEEIASLKMAFIFS